MVVAGDQAAPSLMILVGLVSIAVGVFGFWRWAQPLRAWRNDDEFVPRLELACAALVLFGITSLVVGIAAA